MKASIFFIVALLILSCSSSMIMGNSHEDHCHDYQDCEIWCKQYVPEPKCINHICNCRPPPLTSRRALNIF
ncbi:hypothetical protein IGI04_034965 [Brassica rapa subsp. trilocularis]|uniref:Knottin scorpion toxin-like domain-containing protein n=3 Tax=Brassica TaxID=3705 RepID=A0A8D9FZS1_BRACM|nr:defensin-like protein 308 [Brassica rapa]KAG5383495.1 hypothetical protein IGI04_034965 [Brassica rapa subsp. trilocularis]KAH0910204.1 hypothetical protein HID58_033525 [Brassica napus]CAF2041777.1 unnamed protein product [Brassica napus]CAG7861992.1 unnamed protein product [Brassica rapa]